MNLLVRVVLKTIVLVDGLIPPLRGERTWIEKEHVLVRTSTG